MQSAISMIEQRIKEVQVWADQAAANLQRLEAALAVTASEKEYWDAKLGELHPALAILKQHTTINTTPQSS